MNNILEKMNKIEKKVNKLKKIEVYFKCKLYLFKYIFS